ncbi:MAG: FAD-dependent oxidoreductase [Clostridia bacterium]|nr:FAD-dependent oxidoreductase [Clostridia bacterium]
MKYDLIVAGGGFAGVGAAIAAARQGLSVLLFDKGNCLGGAASNALVMPFMKHSTMLNGEKFFLSRGIFAEIKEKLEKMTDFDGDYYPYSYYFHDENLKLLLNRMAQEAGVNLLYGVYLSEVEQSGEKIDSVTLSGVSGKIKLEADYFIDATGDGNLAFLAGCEYMLGRENDNQCQPMTLCFRVANVDMDLYSEQKPLFNPIYKEAKEKGLFSNPREDVLSFKTLVDGVVHFNTTRVIRKNPTNPFDRTQAEIEAREQVFEIFDFLKKNFSAFKNSSIISTAAETGVRESRMIKGDYLLTKDDLLACKKFPDAIAAANYDIDIHSPDGAGTSHYFFEEGTWYTIPYRCLHPVGKENLLVAGRCISSDHDSQASYRIMPIVCTIGEAAGVAVAVAKKAGVGVGDADVSEIQKIITQTGGFTGLL